MSEKFPTIYNVVVSPEQAGQRLDRWLTTLDFIPSRTRAAELIARGLVTSANQRLKASTKLNSGTKIRVEIPAENHHPALLPLDRPIDILYEDDDLVVVEKPTGLVVHPAAGHAQDTLVNILLHHVAQLSMGFNENRPGIVHRLDRDTSGILVVAKNDLAHQGLARQFRDKTAHRVYWAIVHGVPRPPKGTRRSYLRRHPSDRKRFASDALNQGKFAVTHYEVLESLPSGLSWIQCQLETGRTHQIRVHLSEVGWPIVGDPIYGRNPKRGSVDAEVGRLALHACELGFVHPRTNENLRFYRNWPPDLLDFLTAKGFKNVST